MTVADRAPGTSATRSQTATRFISCPPEPSLEVPRDSADRRLPAPADPRGAGLAAPDEHRESEADFDLLSAVDQALREWLTRAARPNLLVALVAEASLPGRIHGDRRQLIQRLGDWLDHAARSSPAGLLVLEARVDRRDAGCAGILFLLRDDFTGLESLADLAPEPGSRDASKVRPGALAGPGA